MLTHTQINWIASRKPEEDFRFLREYGRTVVIVRGAGGVEVHMDEEGRITAYGMYGAIAWHSGPEVSFDSFVNELPRAT